MCIILLCRKSLRNNICLLKNVLRLWTSLHYEYLSVISCCHALTACLYCPSLHEATLLSQAFFACLAVHVLPSAVLLPHVVCFICCSDVTFHTRPRDDTQNQFIPQSKVWSRWTAMLCSHCSRMWDLHSFISELRNRHNKRWTHQELLVLLMSYNNIFFMLSSVYYKGDSSPGCYIQML